MTFLMILTREVIKTSNNVVIFQFHRKPGCNYKTTHFRKKPITYEIISMYVCGSCKIRNKKDFIICITEKINIVKLNKETFSR